MPQSDKNVTIATGQDLTMQSQSVTALKSGASILVETQQRLNLKVSAQIRLNRGGKPIATVSGAVILVLGCLTLTLSASAADECAVEFMIHSQTVMKYVSAGQTFTYSPAVSAVKWVRSTKVRPVDVQVTNLAPNGPNPKWMTLSPTYPRDPLTGNYSGNVKLYKVRCVSLSFPDTQNTPVPGGSVPIPYPNVGQ